MLLKRILSSLIGILYIFLMIYFGGWFFKLSVLLVSLILMYEFYHAFIKKGYRPVKWLGYLFLSLIFMLMSFSNMVLHKHIYIIFAGGIAIFGLVMTVLNSAISIKDILVTFFAAFYPGMLILLLIPLALESESDGMSILLLALLVTWSTDIFAYFIGSKFGRKKLCPSISPKKTIAGGIGGLAGSILASLFFYFVFSQSLKLDFKWFHFIIIGFLSGILAQLGDLSASSIKRYCNIKDFGKIMPGHGGLLDRLDSLLFTLPFIYLCSLVF
ncbi:MAG: phosphatidate cytidylyltransferase [Clostridiales bacterium]|nr:phosphatidate cytidylyltransferase [Clostridiales bacterium]